MLFFYCLLVIISLSGIFILTRFFVLRRKNLAIDLFAEALRKENSGHLASALELYEKALVEVKKIRFHSKLKEIIIGKIKVIHTVMAYNQSLGFIRHVPVISPDIYSNV